MKRIMLLCAATAAVFTLGAARADAAEYRWRLYGALPTTHDYPKRLMEGLKKIEQRSGGRLSVRYSYYAETPYKVTDALTVMRDGLAEMTEWLPSYSAGTYPVLAAPELPFLLPARTSSADGQAAVNRAWASPSVDAAMKRVLADHGAQLLGRYYFEPMNFWFVKPVKEVKEFHNQKVRVYSPELADLMAHVGSSPVNLSTTEVYTALQRNVLDGVITGSGNIRGSKWNEVLRSGYITNLMFTSTTILVSRKALDKLPADLQAIVVEEMKTTTDALQAFMPQSDAAKQADLKTAGFAITEASPEDYARFREVASTGVWPSWSKRAGGESEKILAEITSAIAGK
ncbi:TRAP transporter substrate-binding protein [Azospirillum sp.]|uniref:TRAP transporter substrate-binding protein n=1 Tax=Azospirillum sp. TaxID=34012 RepID=UPI003D71AB5E